MDLLGLLRERHALCTGCGACYNACPKNAITMTEDREGFLYPSINQEQCINCKKCERTCPCMNTKYNNLSNPDCYAMMASDEERKTSASGGFVSVVARWVLRNDGVVYGVAYDKDWRAIHIAVESEDDLIKIKSSKYFQSDTKHTYQEAVQELKKGRWVLYTGTPCQIAGLYAIAVGTPQEKLITIDILCHGTPSYKIFKKYLDANYDVEKLKIFDFRDKSVFGWSTCSNAYYKDGKEVHIRENKDYYYRAFLPCMIMRPACQVCPMSRLPRQGDFTAGDFWGIRRYNDAFNDKKGTSLVLVNSKRGKEFIKNIIGDCKLWEKVPIEYATHINKTILHPFRSHAGRKHFFSRLDTKPFNKLVDDSLSHNYDIGVVGLWYGINYGSVLTYYALYCLLQDLGYDPVMLPKPNNMWNDSFNRPDTIAQSFIWERCNVFVPCRVQEEYTRFNDLCKDFVLGSDVIWGYNVCGKESGQFFFLDWVEHGHKKIAFAASMGDKLSGPASHIKKNEYYLKKMDAISCRESSGVEIIKAHTGRKDIVQVLDPVFLCNPKTYYDASADVKLTEETPVVFGYVLNSYDISHKYDVIRKAAKHLNTVYRICANPNAHNKIKSSISDVIPVISVNKWLSYMRNCKFYIGDSYHGLCFALIFHKPFIAFVRPKNIPSTRARLESLLKVVGLEDRLIDNFDNPAVFEELFDKPIDWELVDERLKDLKEFSINWLKKAFAKKPSVATAEELIDEEQRRRVNEYFVQLYDQNLRIEKLEHKKNSAVFSEERMAWLSKRRKDFSRYWHEYGARYTLKLTYLEIRNLLSSRRGK